MSDYHRIYAGLASATVNATMANIKECRHEEFGRADKSTYVSEFYTWMRQTVESVFHLFRRTKISDFIPTDYDWERFVEIIITISVLLDRMTNCTKETIAIDLKRPREPGQGYAFEVFFKQLSEVEDLLDTLSDENYFEYASEINEDIAKSVEIALEIINNLKSVIEPYFEDCSKDQTSL